jgi:hypothetical protein
VDDPNAVELGVKFTSDVSGFITGIRFYKGSQNTGTHTGSLWSASGTLLATATFTGESSSGWQQANFSAPVAIAAGATYVASYHTTSGFYAGDSQFFANSGVDRAPLHALSNAAGGGDGIYVYRSGGAFPNSTYQATNYWVDVVFNTMQVTIAPTTLSISGTISPSSGGSGATVTLSGTSTASATADGSGNYSFSGLSNGSYSVTPVNPGFTFTPSNQNVTLNGVNATGVNFTAAQPTFTVSGSISPATGSSGTTIALSGTVSGAVVSSGAKSTATVTTRSSGSFTFIGVVAGTYTITPTNSAFTFSPASQTVTVNGGNLTGVNFTAISVSPTTYAVSGVLSPATGGAGAAVVLSGVASGTTTANSSGSYSFPGLANGTYAVTPSNAGYSFNPTTQAVTISNANVSGVNFTVSVAAATYTVSGSITPASLGAGVAVMLSGPGSATTTADSSGNYSFTALANGSYTVTPSSTKAAFSPLSQTVTVSGANVSGVSFTATGTAGQLSSAWTVLHRPGDGSNSEQENYQPGNVNVVGGQLVMTEQQGTNVATGQYFQNDAPSGNFISCAGGGSNSYTCTSQYSSGAVIWSSFNTQYGDIQVSMKMAQGWPAIWMLGSNCQTTFVTTPDNGGTCNWNAVGSGEIDIAEGYNMSPGAGSVHGNIYESGVSNPACVFSGISDPTQNYHVYELNWTSRGMTWYVDGAAQCSSNANVPDHMFLIINQAIGGIEGGNPTGYSYPNSGSVEWVKVCSTTCSNGTTSAAASNGTFWDDFSGTSSLSQLLVPNSIRINPKQENERESFAAPGRSEPFAGPNHLDAKLQSIAKK